MTPPKHPDVLAWEKWIQSPEGKKIATHYTLPSHGERSAQELLNRLEAAFQAGVKYGREDSMNLGRSSKERETKTV